MTGRHAVYSVANAGRLVGRIREWMHPPDRILDRYIGPGDTVIDLGCGPGHFSIPMASMVGEGGTVIAADVQEEMLSILRKNAEDRGHASRLRFHRTCGGSLAIDLPPLVSFALAFYVLHETVDRRGILADLYRVLRPGGLLLIAEPWFEVGGSEFRGTIEDAERTGFVRLGSPRILFSRSALMQKKP